MYARKSLLLRDSSLWHIYRLNFLRGFALAGAFLVVAIFVYIINEYRWRPKMTSTVQFNLNSTIVDGRARSNPAFEASDVDVRIVTSQDGSQQRSFEELQPKLERKDERTTQL